MAPPGGCWLEPGLLLWVIFAAMTAGAALVVIQAKIQTVQSLSLGLAVFQAAQLCYAAAAVAEAGEAAASGGTNQGSAP